MDAILQYIAQWLTWVADRIYAGMSDIIKYLTDWINVSFQAIFEWFNEVFYAFAQYLGEVVQGIKNYFESILTTIQDFATMVWDKFEEMTTGVMDSIKLFVETTYSEIRVFIQSITSSITDWLNDIARGVVDLIQRGIDVVESLAYTVKENVLQWTDTVIDTAENLYNEVVGRLQVGLDVFIGGAGSLIESIESRLSQLKEAFAEAATTVVAGISETTIEQLGPIVAQVKDFISELTPSGDAQKAQSFVADVKKLTTEKASPEQYKQFLQNYWTVAEPKGGFWAVILFAVIRITGAVLLMGQLSGIQSQVYMQEFAKAYPFAVFTPADVTAAWRRGLVNEEFAIDTIRRQGYSEENAHVVLRLSDMVPQEGDLLHQWHRGLLDEQVVDTALHQRGYDEFFRTSMKTASYLIPPVTDLIVMAVREAFSPEVAERFGQYEDYPPDLTEWAKKQALSEEWAKRYWAAHWSLPSPRQGFEMLHRGVIEEKDLNLLLRALDVMPFWRERLTQIAYTPFTRVDIRRMHRVGVMTEDEVMRAYKDIGYDDKKARKITDFVLLLNAPPSADDEEELKSLTRGNIVGFYTDGLLARDKAISMLNQMGYSAEAANLYLDSADLKSQRDERKEEISFILALTKAGILTFVEAEDRLRTLGLETREVSKAIAVLVREKQRTTNLPSRSEAEKMMKFGAITEDEYKDLLELLGYAPKWREAFLAIAGRA